MFCLKYNNMNTLNLFSLQNPVTYMFSYDSLNSPITGRAEISIYLSLIHTTNFISIYSLYTYNYTKQYSTSVYFARYWGATINRKTISCPQRISNLVFFIIIIVLNSQTMKKNNMQLPLSSCAQIYGNSKELGSQKS